MYPQVMPIACTRGCSTTNRARVAFFTATVCAARHGGSAGDDPSPSQVDVFTENSLIGLSALLFVMEASLEDSALLEMCPLWYIPSSAAAAPCTTPVPLKSPYTTIKQHSARTALRTPGTDGLSGLGQHSGQHIRSVLKRCYGDISRVLGSFLQVCDSSSTVLECSGGLRSIVVGCRVS